MDAGGTSEQGRQEERETPLPMQVVNRAIEAEVGWGWLRWVGGLLILVGLVLLGHGSRGKASEERGAPGAPAASAGRAAGRVVGLGRVLPWSDVVTVAPPFGAGDARVARLQVQEGEQVEQGQVLVVLDNERVLAAGVTAARAAVRAREAAQGQVAASVRASREETKAVVARSEIAAARAARELDRMEVLHKEGATSEQSLELQRSARDEASREVVRVQATLSRYGAGSVHGQADVVAAASQIDVARADLARVEAELERAYVRAPLAGTVLTVHTRVGERPGSVVSLGDLSRMKVEVEVYQTQIGAVSVGDEVECEADALPERLAGVVQRVGLEVGRQKLLGMTPAANTDARVVKVTVALDERSARLARRFSGLEVTARIRPAGDP